MTAELELPPKEDCEEILDPIKIPNELWHRSAIARWVDDGEVTDELFAGGSDDGRQVSGARDSITSAKELYDFRSKVGVSVGVWSLTVDEVRRAGTRLIDDSNCPSEEERVAGHVYLDMRFKSHGHRGSVRMALAGFANQRGPQYLPGSTPSG